jgi:predicted RNA binding protein YcfA (HicA-like mRNA interferase family)
MPAIRPVSFQKLACVFEHEGFRFHRQEGDHRIYVKQGVKRPLVIPMYHEVPVFIIKNLVRTSGLSRDRYFERLREC